MEDPHISDESRGKVTKHGQRRGLLKKHSVLEDKVGKLPQKEWINLFYASKDQDEDLKMIPGFGNTTGMADCVK